MLRFGRRIPITIHPIFWFIAFLIGWLNSSTVVGSIIWTIVILISVLIHEFGHALTSVAFGQSPRIDLMGFGGVTLREGPKLSLWKEFLIVLNGPCAGLILFAIAFQAKHLIGLKGGTYVAFGMEIATYVNLVWTLLNLLPILPLDGGRLVSIILEGLFGVKGLKFSFLLSIILAVAFSAFLFIIQAFLGGALFLMLAFESYRSWQATAGMTAHDQNADLQKLYKEAEDHLNMGSKEEALQQFQQIREESKSGFLYLAATERVAELMYEQGKYQEVFGLLYPIKNEISIGSLKLLHQSAYRLGEWKEAISLGDRAFQAFPSYDTALINALCYALLGKDSPAVGWLQCSIREGLPNLNEIVKKREFDHIRDHTAFQSFLKSL